MERQRVLAAEAAEAAAKSDPKAPKTDPEAAAEAAGAPDAEADESDDDVAAAADSAQGPAESAQGGKLKKLRTQRPDQIGYKLFKQRGLMTSDKVLGHVPGIYITRRYASLQCWAVQWLLGSGTCTALGDVVACVL